MRFFAGKAKELALLVVSTLFACGVGLLVFYGNIFRREDRASKDYFVSDPVIRIRGRPFHPEIAGLGPHDVRDFATALCRSSPMC